MDRFSPEPDQPGAGVAPDEESAVGHSWHGTTNPAAALTTVLAEEYGGTATTAAGIQAATRTLRGAVRVSRVRVRYEPTTQYVTHEGVAGGDADAAAVFGDAVTDGTLFNGLVLVVDAVEGLEPISGVYLRSAHEAGLDSMAERCRPPSPPPPWTWSPSPTSRWACAGHRPRPPSRCGPAPGSPGTPSVVRP
ncbi:hypothetical protein ABZV60_13320 [Streptomyces sp. NPDC004787]|uniref:hypothetical protein n=1 Tax=Streptomyces sp. NPDC004787 TaxID=3154291 RepID=UPI0033BF9C06